MSLLKHRTKFVGAAVSAVYILSNCVFAYSFETNVWAERKRSLLASLPSVDSRSYTGPLSSLRTPAVSSSFRNQKLNPGIKSILASLPYAYGSVRDVAQAKSATEKNVVLIQDIHMNVEAQKNIAKALEKLVQSGSVNLVALEGVFGPVALDNYRNFPEQDTIRTVADFLLDSSNISGAAYTAMTEPMPKTALTGVDDRAQYDANVAAYKKSVPLLDQKKKTIADQSARLQEEKRTAFNPALLKFDAQVQDYRSGRLSLGRYVQILSNAVSPTPLHMELFNEAFKVESTLDYAKVEQERSVLISELVKKLSPEKMADLMDAGVAFRLGQLKPTEFYRTIKDLCGDNHVNLAHYPAMNAYIQYLLLSDNVDPSRLFAEMSSVEKGLYAKLATSAKERQIVDQSNFLYYANKLVNFTLSPDEWAEYKQLPAGNLADRDIFESFYRAADARNQSMAANLLKAMDKSGAKTAVLVVGGYHASTISEALKKAGLTTINFVPKLTKLDGLSESAYLTVFTQEKAPLEKLFDGNKLFVTPDPFGGARFWAPFMAAATTRRTMPEATDATVQNRFDRLAGQGGTQARVTALSQKDGSVRVDAAHDGTPTVSRNVLFKNDGGKLQIAGMADAAPQSKSPWPLLVPAIVGLGYAVLRIALGFDGFTGLDVAFALAAGIPLLNVIFEMVAVPIRKARFGNGDLTAAARALRATTEFVFEINPVLAQEWKAGNANEIRLANPGELGQFEVGRRMGNTIIIHPAYAGDARLIVHELSHWTNDPAQAPPTYSGKAWFYTFGYFVREVRARFGEVVFQVRRMWYIRQLKQAVLYNQLAGQSPAAIRAYLEANRNQWQNLAGFARRLTDAYYQPDNARLAAYADTVLGQLRLIIAAEPNADVRGQGLIVSDTHHGLLESGAEELDLRSSPTRYAVIRYLTMGGRLLIATPDALDQTNAISGRIPSSLRASVAVAPNNGAQWVSFNEDGSMVSDAAYEAGKVISAGDLALIRAAVAASTERYRQMRNGQSDIDDLFVSAHPGFYFREAARQGKARGQLPDAVMELHTTENPETITQVSLAFLSSGRALNDQYRMAHEAVIPDLRQRIIEDLRARLGADLLSRIDVVPGGVSSIDIRMKSAQKSSAIAQSTARMGVPADNVLDLNGLASDLRVEEGLSTTDRRLNQLLEIFDGLRESGEAQSAVAALKNEVERERLSDPRAQATRGALIFNVHGTLLETADPNETLSNSRAKDALIHLLQQGMKVCLISDDPAPVAYQRLIKSSERFATAAGVIHIPEELRYLVTLYTDGGKRAFTFDRNGLAVERSVSNPSPAPADIVRAYVADNRITPVDTIFFGGSNAALPTSLTDVLSVNLGATQTAVAAPAVAGGVGLYAAQLWMEKFEARLSHYQTALTYHEAVPSAVAMMRREAAGPWTYQAESQAVARERLAGVEGGQVIGETYSLTDHSARGDTPPTIAKGKGQLDRNVLVDGLAFAENNSHGMTFFGGFSPLLSGGAKALMSPAEAAQRVPGTRFVFNLLYYVTGRLVREYNRVRSHRPAEQLHRGDFYLDSYKPKDGTERFPLYNKGYVGVDQNGKVIFGFRQLEGGRVRVGSADLSWTAADVNPTGDITNRPVVVYTPAYADKASDDQKIGDVNDANFAVKVGEGRVNLIVVDDEIIGVVDGNVLLSYAGVVISVDKDTFEGRLRSQLDPAQVAGETRTVYRPKAGPHIDIHLDPPADFKGDWNKVQWMMGGGFMLVADGKNLSATPTQMRASMREQGWLNPLSAQSQETPLTAVGREGRDPSAAMGRTKDGRIFIVSFSGRTIHSEGTSFSESVAILEQEFGKGNIDWALSLDGGSSVSLGVVDAAGAYHTMNYPAPGPDTLVQEPRSVSSLGFVVGNPASAASAQPAGAEANLFSRIHSNDPAVIRAYLEGHRNEWANLEAFVHALVDAYYQEGDEALRAYANAAMGALHQILTSEPGNDVRIRSLIGSDIDGTLLPEAGEQHRLSRSPVRYSLLFYLIAGGHFQLITANRLDQAYRVYRDVPTSLLSGLTVTPNTGAQWFDLTPARTEVEDTAYREGKLLSPAERAGIEAAIREAISRYELRLAAAMAADPGFFAAHKEFFRKKAADQSRAPGEFPTPIVDLRGEIEDHSVAQISVMWLSGKAVIEDSYKAAKGEENVPDLRSQFVTDMQELLPPALAAKLDVLGNGAVTVDIRLKTTGKHQPILEGMKRLGLTGADTMGMGDELRVGGGDAGFLKVPDSTPLAVNHDQNKVAPGAVRAGVGPDAVAKWMGVMMTHYQGLRAEGRAESAFQAMKADLAELPANGQSKSPALLFALPVVIGLVWVALKLAIGADLSDFANWASLIVASVPLVGGLYEAVAVPLRKSRFEGRNVSPTDLEEAAAFVVRSDSRLTQAVETRGQPEFRLARAGELGFFEVGRREGNTIIIHPAYATSARVIAHELAHWMNDPAQAPPSFLGKTWYYTIGFLVREIRARFQEVRFSFGRPVAAPQHIRVQVTPESREPIEVQATIGEDGGVSLSVFKDNKEVQMMHMLRGAIEDTVKRLEPTERAQLARKPITIHIVWEEESLGTVRHRMSDHTVIEVHGRHFQVPEGPNSLAVVEDLSAVLRFTVAHEVDHYLRPFDREEAVEARSLDYFAHLDPEEQDRIIRVFSEDNANGIDTNGYGRKLEAIRERQRKMREGVLIFTLEGVLVPFTPTRNFRLHDSPVYHELIDLLKRGFKIAIVARNNNHKVFDQVTYGVPPEDLRYFQNLTVYANRGTAKIIFDENGTARADEDYAKEIDDRDLNAIEGRLRSEVNAIMREAYDAGAALYFPRFRWDQYLTHGVVVRPKDWQLPGQAWAAGATMVTIHPIPSALIPGHSDAGPDIAGRMIARISELLSTYKSRSKQQYEVIRSGRQSIDLVVKGTAKFGALEDILAGQDVNKALAIANPDSTGEVYLDQAYLDFANLNPFTTGNPESPESAGFHFAGVGVLATKNILMQLREAYDDARNNNTGEPQSVISQVKQGRLADEGLVRDGKFPTTLQGAAATYDTWYAQRRADPRMISPEEREEAVLGIFNTYQLNRLRGSPWTTLYTQTIASRETVVQSALNALMQRVGHIDRLDQYFAIADEVAREYGLTRAGSSMNFWNYYKGVDPRICVNARRLRDITGRSPNDIAQEALLESARAGLPIGRVLAGRAGDYQVFPTELRQPGATGPRAPPTRYIYLGGGGAAASLLVRALAARAEEERGKNPTKLIDQGRYSLEIVAITSSYDDGGDTGKWVVGLLHNTDFGTTIIAPGDIAAMMVFATNDPAKLWFIHYADRMYKDREGKERIKVGKDLTPERTGPDYGITKGESLYAVFRGRLQLAEQMFREGRLQRPDDWLTFANDMLTLATQLDRDVVSRGALAVNGSGLNVVGGSAQNFFIGGGVINSGALVPTDGEYNRGHFDPSRIDMTDMNGLLGVRYGRELPASVEVRTLVSLDEHGNEIARFQTRISDQGHTTPTDRLALRLPERRIPVNVEHPFDYRPLRPEERPHALPEVIAQIENVSKVLISGLGSPFTSILPDLMVLGIAQAVAGRTDVPRLWGMKTKMDLETSRLYKVGEKGYLEPYSLQEQIHIIERTMAESGITRPDGTPMRFEDVFSHILLADIPENRKRAAPQELSELEVQQLEQGKAQVSKYVKGVQPITDEDLAFLRSRGIEIVWVPQEAIEMQGGQKVDMVYHAIARKAVEQGVPLTDEAAVSKLAKATTVSFHRNDIVVDGVDVTADVSARARQQMPVSTKGGDVETLREYPAVRALARDAAVEAGVMQPPEAQMDVLRGKTPHDADQKPPYYITQRLLALIDDIAGTFVAPFRHDVISVDGNGGARVTNVAKNLASQLGWTYLDSDVLYRALASKARAAKIELGNEARMSELVMNTTFGFQDGRLTMDGKPAESQITETISRTPDAVAKLRTFAVVQREIDLTLQRVARTGRFVVDAAHSGQDIAPDAAQKVYLDARGPAVAGTRPEGAPAGAQVINHDSADDQHMAQAILSGKGAPRGAIILTADQLLPANGGAFQTSPSYPRFLTALEQGIPMVVITNDPLQLAMERLLRGPPDGSSVPVPPALRHLVTIYSMPEMSRTTFAPDTGDPDTLNLGTLPPGASANLVFTADYLSENHLDPRQVVSFTSKQVEAGRPQSLPGVLVLDVSQNYSTPGAPGIPGRDNLERSAHWLGVLNQTAASRPQKLVGRVVVPTAVQLFRLQAAQTFGVRGETIQDAAKMVKLESEEERAKGIRRGVSGGQTFSTTFSLPAAVPATPAVNEGFNPDGPNVVVNGWAFNFPNDRQWRLDYAFGLQAQGQAPAGAKFAFNFLPTVTPEMIAAYNAARADRPAEQLTAYDPFPLGHYQPKGEPELGGERFPLYNKGYVGIDERGHIRFGLRQLRGGQLRLSLSSSLRWEEADVNPADVAQMPIAVYTPAYAQTVGQPADKVEVGKDRVNIVVVDDKIVAVLNSPVLLPSVGVVISVEPGFFNKDFAGQFEPAEVAGETRAVLKPKQPYRFELDPPAGFVGEWRNMQWMMGGGAMLVAEGVNLVENADAMRTNLAKQGFTGDQLDPMRRDAVNILGLTKDGKLFMFTFSGRSGYSSGVTIPEAVAIVDRELGDNLWWALNLEGGSSVQLSQVNRNGASQLLSIPGQGEDTILNQARPVHTMGYIVGQPKSPLLVYVGVLAVFGISLALGLFFNANFNPVKVDVLWFMIAPALLLVWAIVETASVLIIKAFGGAGDREASAVTLHHTLSDMSSGDLVWKAAVATGRVPDVRLAAPGQLGLFQTGKRVGDTILIHPAYAGNQRLIRHELAHWIYDAPTLPTSRLGIVQYWTTGFVAREVRARLAEFGLLRSLNVAASLAEEDSLTGEREQRVINDFQTSLNAPNAIQTLGLPPPLAAQIAGHLMERSRRRLDWLFGRESALPPARLYNLFIEEHLNKAEAALAAALDNPDPTTPVGVERIIRWVLERQPVEMRSGYFVRRRTLEQMIRSNPPTQLMAEVLGGESPSVDDLLRRFDVLAIFQAARFTENDAWRRQLSTELRKLKPTDFERREIQPAILDPVVWKAVAQKLEKEKRYVHYGKLTGIILGTPVNPDVKLPVLRGVLKVLSYIKEDDLFNRVWEHASQNAGAEFGDRIERAYTGYPLSDNPTLGLVLEGATQRHVHQQLWQLSREIPALTVLAQTYDTIHLVDGNPVSLNAWTHVSRVVKNEDEPLLRESGQLAWYNFFSMFMGSSQELDRWIIEHTGLEHETLPTTTDVRSIPPYPTSDLAALPIPGGAVGPSRLGSIVMDPDVPTPTADSRALLEAGQRWVREHRDLQDRSRLLVVGSRGGILPLTLGGEFHRVVTTDANPYEAALTATNVDNAGVSNVSVRSGNGFDPVTKVTPEDRRRVPEKFDLILAVFHQLSTPPDVPADRYFPAIQSYEGGPNGRAQLDAFLSGLSDHLRSGGSAFFSQPESAGVSKTEEALRRANLDIEYRTEVEAPETQALFQSRSAYARGVAPVTGRATVNNKKNPLMIFGVRKRSTAPAVAAQSRSPMPFIVLGAIVTVAGALLGAHFGFTDPVTLFAAVPLALLVLAVTVEAGTTALRKAQAAGLSAAEAARLLDQTFRGLEAVDPSIAVLRAAHPDFQIRVAAPGELGRFEAARRQGETLIVHPAYVTDRAIIRHELDHLRHDPSVAPTGWAAVYYYTVGYFVREFRARRAERETPEERLADRYIEMLESPNPAPLLARIVAEVPLNAQGSLNSFAGRLELISRPNPALLIDNVRFEAALAARVREKGWSVDQVRARLHRASVSGAARVDLGDALRSDANSGENPGTIVVLNDEIVPIEDDALNRLVQKVLDSHKRDGGRTVGESVFVVNSAALKARIEAIAGQGAVDIRVEPAVFRGTVAQGDVRVAAVDLETRLTRPFLKQFSHLSIVTFDAIPVSFEGIDPRDEDFAFRSAVVAYIDKLLNSVRTNSDALQDLETYAQRLTYA